MQDGARETRSTRDRGLDARGGREGGGERWRDGERKRQNGEVHVQFVRVVEGSQGSKGCADNTASETPRTGRGERGAARRGGFWEAREASYQLQIPHGVRMRE